MIKVLKWGSFGAVGLFLLIQLVPYGRSHTNPPVTGEPNWDNRRTRRLAQDACFSCHSNETEYSWYSHIAPASWLIQRDIEQGREALNFSEFHRGQEEAEEAAETVVDGEMAPLRYTIINPDARLSDAEKRQLIEGLRATPGGDGDNSGPGSDDSPGLGIRRAESGRGKNRPDSLRPDQTKLATGACAPSAP
jgi:mono/diheme cytochrome c family protein